MKNAITAPGPIAVLCLLSASSLCAAANDPLGWPTVRSECRPWAYNWWPASAVDPENISRELQRCHDAGLGGIHIIPIYGVRGEESRYIDYLSPKWMEMMSFAVTAARRLGMGVDMTTGTGWCFGGPNLEREEGCWVAQTQVRDVGAGGNLAGPFDPQKVMTMIAISAQGERVDLKPKLDVSGHLAWQPEAEAWRVYIVTAKPSGLKVKRAGPGGVGPMMDPFSPTAMEHYLKPFTDVFGKAQGVIPRSMYHDSYEYNGNWTPHFAEAFAKKRGYDLTDQIAAFCTDPSQSEEAGRVRCDYNETLSDLMVEEVFPIWVKWCHDHGMITRYQAHGSPGNLLDLYALADIPETEMFGRGERDPLKSGFDARFGEGARSPLVSKFASSAPHVAGRQLAASETGTWMAEHFCETLEEMKCLQDRLMLSGINHIFYHGCCYSPDEAAWPGWLFYAATEMNPRNTIWHDVPALNAYVTRCQSVLQSGRPANDVLLYWPIHDFWQNSAQLAPGLGVDHRGWVEDQPFGRTAQMLWDRGYGFDYVSDRQLATASVDTGGAIAVPGGSYRVVLVPPTKMMPLPTLQNLLRLAKNGGTVLFQEHLPADVPGAGDLANRRAAMKSLLVGLTFAPAGEKIEQATLGKGRILVGDAEAILGKAGVVRESMVDAEGVKFIRRANDDGWSYFIANQGMKLLNGRVTLGTPAASAVVLDPMTGQTGVTRLTASPAGPLVYLRLEPGASLILRTYASRVQGPAFVFVNPGETIASIGGPWKVRFQEGGPALPKAFETSTLESWTKHGDPAAQNFGGTAVYSTLFDAPSGSGPWVLDLGEVCHSARIRVNGKDRGTLLMHPYRLLVEDLLPKDNVLEIEVTNLAANRIRDLDRRHVKWKIFADINIVNIKYKPFDASDWPIFDSGLLGPVTLHTQTAEQKQ